MKKIILMVVFLTLFLCNISNASLIGDEIIATATFSSDLSATSATIGSDTEFVYIGDFLFDFQENQLTIFHNGSSSHGGNRGYLTFSGFDNPITGLSTISVDDGWTGSVLNYSFTESSIIFDFTNFLVDHRSSQYGGYGDTDKEFVISIAQSPVPEPSTSALFGIGLLGLAGVYRKKLIRIIAR